METIFNITGRVDFLDIPILDKIEKDHEKWEIPNIPKINGDRKVEDIRKEIMQKYYFQQIPAIIPNFGKIFSSIDWIEDLNKEDITNSTHYVAKKWNSEFKDKFSFCYKYNEKNFNIAASSNSNLVEKLKSKDPFKGILGLTSVWYNKKNDSFKTIPVRSNAQKLICNIAYSHDESHEPGTMNVTLLHPLWLRYVPLHKLYASGYEGTKYSEVEDMYRNESEQHNYNTPFRYNQTVHLELKPYDCLYLPNHWWMQIVFDHIVLDDSDPTSDKDINAKEPKNATLAWIEYHYPTISTFEDVLLEGLMEGYGS